MAEEALAVRSGVGLIDASAAAKFEVSGRHAARYLDRVLATALPQVGAACAGYQLFENGGVRAAYTVSRLEENLFYLMSGARSEQLNFDELWRLLPHDDGVALRNVTMERGSFAIAGPRSRDVLAFLIEASLSNDAFPPGAVKTMCVGLAHDVWVMRVSSTGELGWELHPPIAYQRHLLERILAARIGHGLRPIGQRALNPLRLEKSYRAIGSDMNVEISALDAGLASMLDLDKGPFIGRDAVRQLQARRQTRRLATITIATQGASLLGHETVYHMAKPPGRITSGGFSPYFGHDIALALLPVELSTPGTELTVPVLDDVRDARVIADSPYDPEGLRCLM
jgi:dimethylglycine dehydrogenase